jgi:hypothetical protein
VLVVPEPTNKVSIASDAGQGQYAPSEKVTYDFLAKLEVAARESSELEVKAYQCSSDRCFKPARST